MVYLLYTLDWLKDLFEEEKEGSES